MLTLAKRTIFLTWHQNKINCYHSHVSVNSTRNLPKCGTSLEISTKSSYIFSEYDALLHETGDPGFQNGML